MTRPLNEEGEGNWNWYTVRVILTCEGTHLLILQLQFIFTFLVKLAVILSVIDQIDYKVNTMVCFCETTNYISSLCNRSTRQLFSQNCRF